MFAPSAHYGDNKIVLLVRDPWWVYAYWEVTSRREGEVRTPIECESLGLGKTVLRLYDVTPGQPESFFDVEVGNADNWHVEVGIPDREWIAELGIRTAEGAFFVLVRSSKVRTPRFEISDVVDEEWMLPEELFWKLFGRTSRLSNPSSSSLALVS